MPLQQTSPVSVETNFTKGLLTEFTGLNFPENAATETNNCTYTLIGDVTRRQGIDFETNFATNSVSRTGAAISNYKWNNAGGDGESQIVVSQVGNTLFFYLSSEASTSGPLSTQILAGTITLTAISGGTFDATQECTFADGNGYLFVYHPSCDPAYVTFNPGSQAFTTNNIQVQIRDFVGAMESVPVNARPITLSNEHSYNLQNQGWTTANPWSGIDTQIRSNPMSLGSNSFVIATGLTITNGTLVNFSCDSVDLFGNVTGVGIGTGSVTSYNSGTGALVLSVFSYSNIAPTIFTSTETLLTPISIGYISAWVAAEGNYPSNADVWWYFKNSSNAFDPATTAAQVDLATGQAPQGHYILPAFSMSRTQVSGVGSLTSVVTMKRPTNGCWFQGRLWYTGIYDSFPPSGDSSAYSWTENIYFSQVVQTPSDLGLCYQTNDPTSENLFDLLPTDGGVISQPGTGNIYKLFPIQNGMLVFAANGVWFITGSKGIGFAADDYTMTKISSVRSISPYSFVDVNGLPFFWNEEGIYAVEPQQGGGLAVNPLTVGTIQTFYDNIPFLSKLYAHAAYDPIGYVIQWLYKTETEVSVTDRYSYDGILNFNTYNKAFYPYTVDNSASSINGIIYVASPGGLAATESSVKYFVSDGGKVSFGDEHDDSFTDWVSQVPVNYSSYFITGYKLHGQGQRRFQMPYIYVYSRPDEITQTVAYKIQGLWDYATSGNSGRWSTTQVVNNWSPNFGLFFRRHRIRGRGLVLQLKVSSVDGQPFDIMGWSAYEAQQQGV